MMELPEPLVPAEVDCSDLDGFMLNVERLMASELVALGTHEEIAAALFLWCRAWKQSPAASLPDDDRVNAAFARLPLARFKKLKANVMRGFVKCSDGRLYHRFLAREAQAAFDRKEAFRRKRDADAERLRKWRGEKNERIDEARSETQHETRVEPQAKRQRNKNETRFVAEGQGQGHGQGIIDNLPAQLPVAAHEPPRTEKPASERPSDPGAARGKSELDAVEAACREALGEAQPQDVVIGPMVEIVRKFGQERVSLCLASEVRRPRRRPIRTWRIWAEIVAETLAGAPRAPSAQAPPDEPAGFFVDRQRAQIREWIDTGKRNAAWNESVFGPPPDQPGCRIPNELLAEFGLSRVPYPRDDEVAA
ncbi:MAG: DUF1376 domain-containing protein [Methylocystis sp.]